MQLLGDKHGMQLHAAHAFHGNRSAEIASAQNSLLKRLHLPVRPIGARAWPRTADGVEVLAALLPKGTALKIGTFIPL